MTIKTASHNVPLLAAVFPSAIDAERVLVRALMKTRIALRRNWASDPHPVLWAGALTGIGGFAVLTLRVLGY